MTIDEYQTLALRTAAPGDEDRRLVTACLGLSGEVGEFTDHVKKWFAQGHPVDYDKLALELGDVLWYVALAADALGVPLSAIARANVHKLEVRYGGTFTSDASQHRAAR